MDTAGISQGFLNYQQHAREAQAADAEMAIRKAQADALRQAAMQDALTRQAQGQLASVMAGGAPRTPPPVSAQGAVMPVMPPANQPPAPAPGQPSVAAPRPQLQPYQTVESASRPPAPMMPQSPPVPMNMQVLGASKRGENVPAEVMAQVDLSPQGVARSVMVGLAGRSDLTDEQKNAIVYEAMNQAAPLYKMQLEARQSAEQAARQAFMDKLAVTREDRMARSEAARERHMMTMEELAARRLNGQVESVDGSTLDDLVAIARTGQPKSQVVGGYGKAAQKTWEQVQSKAIRQIMDENPELSRADAAKQFTMEQLGLKGKGKSIGNLTDMLGAANAAVKQLDYNIAETEKILKKIPSSDLSPVVNAIARGAQVWSGDPRYNELFYFMRATALESARILHGGTRSAAQLNVHAAEEAKKWADANWTTPEQFIKGVAPAMRREGQARLSQLQEAISEMKDGTTGKDTSGDTMSDEDRRMIEAAKQDPNNPKAKAVLEYWGIK